MLDAQVRRLPVVNDIGHLVGAISIDDLVPHPGQGYAPPACWPGTRLHVRPHPPRLRGRRPRSPWQKPRCIRAAMHPAWTALLLGLILRSRMPWTVRRTERFVSRQRGPVHHRRRSCRCRRRPGADRIAPKPKMRPAADVPPIRDRQRSPRRWASPVSRAPISAVPSSANRADLCRPAQGWEEVRAGESSGAAGPGRDGAPGHVGVRAVPGARHQAGDALPVRRPAGRAARAGPEGPWVLKPEDRDA